MIHQEIFLHEGRKDVSLTTFVIDHSGDFLHGRKRPSVIVCPGGAYLTLSGAEGEPVAAMFMSMGYHAFVLKYSTYMGEKPGLPKFGTIPPVNEDSIFPKPMQDIALAIKCLKEHEEEWAIDTDQIILCGFSAGAHNCGMYNVLSHSMNMPRPLLAILGYPVADYSIAYDLPLDTAVNIAIKGKPSLSPSDTDEMSILKHIDEHTSPMFIWNTAEDKMVPPENGLAIAVEMARHKIPCEIHSFAKGPHCLSLASEGSAVSKNDVRDDVAVWKELLLTWLRKYVKFDLPETAPF